MLADVTLTLLSVVLAVTVQCQELADERCQSPVTVTIESTRDHMGKWTEKVELEHPKNSGPWLVKTDVCEGKDTIRITKTISSAAVSPSEIPPGYELFPGVGFYKFHPNGTTWPRARQICAEEGAHLAIINSMREADVTVQLFARFPKPLIDAAGNDDWAWLGGHEMGVEGEYFTIFGEPMETTGYMRWHAGQPNDKALNSALVSNRISGALGDAYPAWKAAFICEVEI